ncbi:hypothetical protein BCR33DRAFT_823902 [Rhizoclosmatium globosum]|uniref:Homeobox domain-containing protein n=1 Tax=Rhizoclosmatium globosum TaxID=329046 RepID=A0A1Y2CZ32_9FUNG|nr:hypothetical protein BCR33DRAFT_823902 [Rhizoclosmatium globosum]|eukprot:ORY52303.1 hypothetical protein BCR33DRAFT_823902 [Rhizoclosmatium globosum]
MSIKQNNSSTPQQSPSGFNSLSEHPLLRQLHSPSTLPLSAFGDLSSTLNQPQVATQDDKALMSTSFDSDLDFLTTLSHPSQSQVILNAPPPPKSTLKNVGMLFLDTSTTTPLLDQQIQAAFFSPNTPSTFQPGFFQSQLDQAFNASTTPSGLLDPSYQALYSGLPIGSFETLSFQSPTEVPTTNFFSQSFGTPTHTPVNPFFQQPFTIPNSTIESSFARDFLGTSSHSVPLSSPSVSPSPFTTNRVNTPRLISRQSVILPRYNPIGIESAPQSRHCSPLPTPRPKSAPQSRVSSPVARDSLNSSFDVEHLSAMQTDPDAKRFRLPKQQMDWLKSRYEENPFPTPDEVLVMANKLGMNKRKLRIW